MEKVNGGTLESFIKKKRILINQRNKEISGSNKTGDKTTVDAKSNLKSENEAKRPTVIPEQVASTITRDICNGLHQIHKKNFIHRDLKPENILINESKNPDGSLPEKPEDQYQAKIADFGLSAEVHSNVFRGQDKIVDVTGTILFMAPEQATGQRQGKRVDMWALGIIVF